MFRKPQKSSYQERPKFQNYSINYQDIVSLRETPVQKMKSIPTLTPKAQAFYNKHIGPTHPNTTKASHSQHFSFKNLHNAKKQYYIPQQFKSSIKQPTRKNSIKISLNISKIEDKENNLGSSKVLASAYHAPLGYNTRCTRRGSSDRRPKGGKRGFSEDAIKMVNKKCSNYNLNQSQQQGCSLSQTQMIKPRGRSLKFRRGGDFGKFEGLKNARRLEKVSIDGGSKLPCMFFEKERKGKMKRNASIEEIYKSLEKEIEKRRRKAEFQGVRVSVNDALGELKRTKSEVELGLNQYYRENNFDPGLLDMAAADVYLVKLVELHEQIEVGIQSLLGKL